MTTPNLPALDTPEARWAYVLQLWHEHSLPTPTEIDIERRCITLSDNECRQVDAWGRALGCEPAKADTKSKRANYAAFGRGDRLWWVWCDIDLAIGVPEGPIGPELASAVDGVVGMLTHEHGYTTRDGLDFLPADAGCTGCCEAATDAYRATLGDTGQVDAQPGPQLASAWQNEDGAIGSECRCGVTFDGFERKDSALLDELFAKHVCNTLPPVCGFLGGCDYDPDKAPAPAEPDGHGLCTQHRADVFPELAGGA